MPFSKMPETRRLQRQLTAQEQELSKTKKELEKMRAANDPKLNVEPPDTATIDEVQDMETPADDPETEEDEDTPTVQAGMPTPKREAIKLLADLGLSPNPARLKVLMPVSVTVDSVKKAPRHLKRQLFETPTTVKRVASGVSKRVNLSRKLIGAKKKEVIKKTCREETRQLVIDFLCRSDNANELPSKKDVVRGQQQYSLTDTLMNLHRKFQAENAGNPEVRICLSEFCKARPKFVRLIAVTQRRQCLCQRCANMCLRATASKVLPRTPNGIAEMSSSDISEKLNRLPARNLKFQQWLRTEIAVGADKKKTKLLDVTITKQEFIDDFLQDVPSLRQHCFRITMIGEEIRSLKHTMEPLKEATVQVDYAENWAVKYNMQISAAFYDNDQVSMHPMVIHYRAEEGTLETHSYVGISAEGSHTFATSLTFILRMLEMLQEMLPQLEVVHFISDGPSSQYRNRTVVEAIKRFQELSQLKCSWTWLEAGHGKGPCDGVGGGLKKKADNLVKGGAVIRNTKELVSGLDAVNIKSDLVYVVPQEVQRTQALIKRWTPTAVKGLMKMHIAAAENGKVFVREVPCFGECCYREQHFNFGCEGWRQVGPAETDSSDDTESDDDPYLEEEDVEDEVGEEVMEEVEEEIGEEVMEEVEVEIGEEGEEEEVRVKVEPEAEAQTFVSGQYVVVVYGRRWYPTRVLAVKATWLQIAYMAPYGHRWKWGNEDLGEVEKDCVLAIIRAPRQSGKLWSLTKKDEKHVNKLFREYLRGWEENSKK